VLANGFDVATCEVDVGDPLSVEAAAANTSSKGPARRGVHAAGLSPRRPTSMRFCASTCSV
jgi:hypothetical protein